MSVIPEFTILLIAEETDDCRKLYNWLCAYEKKVQQVPLSSDYIRHNYSSLENSSLAIIDSTSSEIDALEIASLLRTHPQTKDIAIIFLINPPGEEHAFSEKALWESVDYLQPPFEQNLLHNKIEVFKRLFFYKHEWKNSLLELKKINRQLEDFSYIIAHDLKSPLSSIITTVSVLEQDKVIQQNKKTQEYIGLIASASKYLSDMITSLLEYSRKSIQEQTLEEVDTHELVSEIAHLLFPPSHIRIRINRPMPVLKTKKLRLAQAFQNLISNAIKYNDKETGTIEIGSTESPDCYVFYVRDNGPGLSEEEQKNIFRLFRVPERPPAAGDSTGIGLNILKMIVEEQGGKLYVSSEPGQGSTFSFEWMKNKR